MKNMHCLTPKVLVTRTVPQSRTLSNSFWFVANVKVYECKNLDSINGLDSFDVNNGSILLLRNWRQWRLPSMHC